MRILQVNKFYYPKRGADKYFLFLEKLLKERGHEVSVFSMDSSSNLPSDDSKYFSKEIDLHTKNWFKKIKFAFAIIYNLNAKKQFTRLLKSFKPDIIHCHNIYHQLSPSILDAARKAKIPVVMHLHDYKLICPNYKLYTKDKYCQRCRGGNYTQCIQNRCVENNLAKSILAAIEMTIHHKFLKIYKKGVGIFIAPSKFMRNICIEFGWEKNKFQILENISDNHNTNQEIEIKNHFLYFGALEKEKGIDILIKSAAQSKVSIKIAGTGSQTEILKDLSKKLKANVEFLGHLQGSQLEKQIKEALAIVIPSRWPENMPLAAIEAMNLSKTVIAADIGGLSELIKPGLTGYLFSPNNTDSLSAILTSLTKEKAKIIGEKAFESRKNKNKDWHYNKLIEIYQTAIKDKPLN